MGLSYDFNVIFHKKHQNSKKFMPLWHFFRPNKSMSGGMSEIYKNK